MSPMAVTPEAMRLGVVFPSPSPLTRSQFEEALRPLNGSVNEGVGGRLTGEQVPILVFQWPQGVVIYDSTLGNVSIDIRHFPESAAVEGTFLNPLASAANLQISELKGFEVDAAFILNTPSTALAALTDLAGLAPPWVDEVMETRMRGWGVRFIGVTATGVRRPFREETPWTELTIEPFGNNPTKAFIRFLVRCSGWEETKAWLDALPVKADTVREHLFQ